MARGKWIVKDYKKRVKIEIKRKRSELDSHVGILAFIFPKGNISLLSKYYMQ